MFYLIYKTTNKINGKIYIGCHVTKNIDDGYMGSGKILKKAINKYGIENFKKEIIEVFYNSEDMFKMESKLVNEDFVKQDNNYNLKIGGEGGWDYINSKPITNIKRKNISKGIKKAYKDGVLKPTPQNFKNGFKGKHHSDESKNKISKNNGNKLDKSCIELRTKDLLNIDLNKRGCIKKLSEKWCVSHTQVRRFINKYKK